jgi:hypothetical protein
LVERFAEGKSRGKLVEVNREKRYVIVEFPNADAVYWKAE